MDQLAAQFSRFRVTWATLCLMSADLVALTLALLLAFCLRFDDRPFAHLLGSLADFWLSLSLGAVAYLCLFALFRLYRHAWRFASIEMVWGIVAANTLGVLVLVLLQAFTRALIFPRSVLIIFWFVSIMLVGGVRIILRLAHLLKQSPLQSLTRLIRRDTPGIRVVILGGGWEGARLLRALHEELGGGYQVVGFLDDHPEKQGVYIRGVRVLGPLAHLYILLATRAVDEVLIAMPQASGAELREYVLACRVRGVRVRVIPGLANVLRGTARPQLEDISVEDLLRRPPVCMETAVLGQYVTGKRVLVTGAGGSIGSELCRQILALAPSSLILLGHGENSIHQIQQELQVKFPTLADRLHLVIASVADASRIASVFAHHRPHVVFHAAAHKHVPIMEDNVAEAILNNVIGTYNVAEACGRYEVERMVLISTDKAVYPSSVMGATKWLAEETLRALVEVYPDTAYVAVRFGNVLGSRGSVVPIFQEQIARGGPVTVTHPEMTRYFMTIPEAVTLVLQAGAIGRSGELYLLDMGKPVKIVDLAKDMIRLSGLEPETDIAITFTGLRPGEKLHEQLAMDETQLRPARCERMSVVTRPATLVPHDFLPALARVKQLVDANDTVALIDYLGETVPGFDERERFASLVDDHRR